MPCLEHADNKRAVQSWTRVYAIFVLPEGNVAQVCADLIGVTGDAAVRADH